MSSLSLSSMLLRSACMQHAHIPGYLRNKTAHHMLQTPHTNSVLFVVVILAIGGDNIHFHDSKYS